MGDKPQSNSSLREDISAILDFLQVTRDGKLSPIDDSVITGTRVDYVLSDCQDEYYYSIS